MFARGKCQLKNSQRVIEKSHRKGNEKSFKYKCHRCGKVGQGKALSIKPCSSATAATNKHSDDPSILLFGQNVRDFPLHWWPIQNGA
ncbi:hypothetical protein T12_15927 [Trichinella patagoniensis]|uniref:Uncharacterized protein n=1 Tax=Trichinella patagoniensis TaxID=990121 RepID=A0A0V0Z745_9BILA|nr:hypothetical protein T12_15927 [Trichinella patagoniensis]